ncbi:MAG: sialidase family protein [Gaiellaceae bacterium]
MGSSKPLTRAVILLTGGVLAAAATAGAARAPAKIQLHQISRDPYVNADSQHATEVEPDTASSGSTVVAVFQVGRISDGGAANIGFAVTRNRGRTWKHGFMPGLTANSKAAGTWPRVSDPTVAYDPVHGAWLSVSIGFGGDTSAFLVNRSADGLHWGAPVTTNLRSGFQLDKEWVACDDWPSSPYRGHCYLSYDDLETAQIATQVSTDGGVTWSAPVSAAGFPGRASIQGTEAPGVQPVVRPDGTVVVPYFDETALTEIRSADGGATWLPATTIAPAKYHPPSGLRAAPLPSAAVDGAGTVYVAWADCSLRLSCSANDLVVARSADGLTWATPVKVPTRAPDAEIPGLAADRGTPGRLALAYYTVRSGSRLNVAFLASKNGGLGWTNPRRLNSVTFPLAWIASTSLGSMVGDYISTSFAGGRAVPVFALALRPGSNGLRESMYSTSLAVPR